LVRRIVQPRPREPLGQKLRRQLTDERREVKKTISSTKSFAPVAYQTLLKSIKFDL
jgi:IS5 family transposase